MKIVIDVSVYQDSYTFDNFKLLKDNGVDGVIIRAGCAHDEDDMLPTFVQWCRELGLPFGFYFYFYPGLGIKHQAELFQLLVSQYPDCLGVWPDIEEYKNPSTGTNYSPDTLNAFYKGVFDYMKAAFPDRVVGNYSGGWVLDKYIPRAWTWINSAPYWNAYYVKPFYWYQNFISSLGAIWDSDMRLLPLSNFKVIMEEINKHWPPNPVGVQKVSMWQALTWFPYLEKLTYWQKHIDVNICSDADFALLFPQPVVTPEPEPIAEKIVRGWRRLWRWI